MRRADAAHHACSQVADNVAVEIAHHEDIELLRLDHHLHAAVIDDDFTDLHFGKLAGRVAKNLQKQAISQLEDVGFVDAMNRLAASSSCPFKCKAEEAAACGFRDYLD